MGWFDTFSDWVGNPLKAAFPTAVENVEASIAKSWRDAENEAARITTKTMPKEIQKYFGEDDFLSQAGQGFVPQIMEGMGYEDSDRVNIIEESVYGPDVPYQPSTEQGFSATLDPLKIEQSARRLRVLLGKKRGIKSTNVTGGLFGKAQGTKPTLFTL